MSSIKFQHVFAALLFLSGLSAFVIPVRFTAKAQPQVQSLFYPVARPVRSIAGWFHDRVARPEAKDSRSTSAVLEENESLRQEFAVLSQTLDDLRRRNAEREKLGDLRSLCTPFSVIGDDAGQRDALLIHGSTLEGLKQGQVALYAGGVAGVIERPPGLAGAQVRLITDVGFRVEAFFARFERDAEGKSVFHSLETPPVVLEGTGQGAMRCLTALTMEDVRTSGLQVNDYVALRDREWDKRMEGCRLGKISRIAPKPASPLYADIRIEPAAGLLRLREVMVVTK